MNNPLLFYPQHTFKVEIRLIQLYPPPRLELFHISPFCIYLYLCNNDVQWSSSQPAEPSSIVQYCRILITQIQYLIPLHNSWYHVFESKCVLGIYDIHFLYKALWSLAIQYIFLLAFTSRFHIILQLELVQCKTAWSRWSSTFTFSSECWWHP